MVSISYHIDHIRYEQSKPCVASFGGDQFRPHQEHHLEGYFSAFYLSINFGSFISTLITPKLRADVGCFGYQECYFLAFGVPALLMLVATIIFLLGHPTFDNKIPRSNVMLKTFAAIKTALYLRFFKSEGKVQKSTIHWMDSAAAKHGEKLVNDIKDALPVLGLFLPLGAFFWCLYDQTGSRWTIQAKEMKTFDMGALGEFRPDQMQALNSVLILILVPVFFKYVYPGFERTTGYKLTPLRKMTAGMGLCGVAFLVSGLIQLEIDASNRLPSVSDSEIGLRILSVQSDVTVTLDGHETLPAIALADRILVSHEIKGWGFAGDIDINITSSTNLQASCPFDAGNFHSVFVTNSAIFCVLDVIKAVSTDGESLANMQVVNCESGGEATVRVEVGAGEDAVELKANSNSTSGYRPIDIQPDEQKIEITATGGVSRLTYNFDEGESLTLVLVPGGGAYIIEDLSGAQVSILWQVPQYFILTSSEILFSVVSWLPIVDFSLEEPHLISITPLPPPT